MELHHNLPLNLDRCQIESHRYLHNLNHKSKLGFVFQVCYFSYFYVCTKKCVRQYGYENLHSNKFPLGQSPEYYDYLPSKFGFGVVAITGGTKNKREKKVNSL